MRNDALFIDGHLMDLDDNTKITLKLKSNVFTEVSKIVSNNSYTIKLPKTVHNQKIIDNSDIPAYQSEFPYKIHKARYFRNGVEIIKDGHAVMMAANENIEVVLVWGNFVNFSNIVSQGLSLRDLSGDDVIYFEKVNTYEPFPNNKPYFYAYFNSRKYEKEEVLNNNEDITDRTRPSYSSRVGSYPIHPVVRVPWILEKVYEKTGVRFDFSGKGLSLVNSLLIPLIDKKSNEFTLGDNHECAVDVRSGFGDLKYKVTKGLDMFEVNQVGAYGSYFKVKADSTIRFTFSGTASFYYNSSANNRNNSWQYMRVVLVIDGEEIIMATPRLDRETGIKYYGWNEMEISGYCTNALLTTQNAYIKFKHVYGGKTPIQNLVLKNAMIKCSPNVPDEVPFNSYFPIISNLPDIKIIDLIKALSCLCGVFAKQEKGIVKFISLDDIYEHKNKALNWTKRVVASYRDNKPKEINFEVSDYCQHNYFKWKEDDMVEGDYDGDLIVDNKTLDYEKDSITLQFAATDGCNIPMYTFTLGTDGNKGTYQHSSCKPRLLKEVGGTWYSNRNPSRPGSGGSVIERSYALFDGLDFDTILNERYEKLRRVLNHAKIIKENILISEYDLKEFDESIPVYLGQYGKYFAVIEIKAEDNGIAEVQLLQL